MYKEYFFWKTPPQMIFWKNNTSILRTVALVLYGTYPDIVRFLFSSVTFSFFFYSVRTYYVCKIEVLFFQNIIWGGVFQKKVLFVHEYIFITILSADELLDKNGWAKTSLFMGQKTGRFQANTRKCGGKAVVHWPNQTQSTNTSHVAR